jgi:uncharacterized Zn-finger protein
VPGHTPKDGRASGTPSTNLLILEIIMADPLTIEVTARELPVRCPPIDTAAWKQHPRVYLDVLQTGQARCPYCGTRYVFQGAAPKSH